MIKRFLAALACICFFVSCSDEDYKLEGKWQMQQVEGTGVVMPVDTVYYNFQNNLFMYQIANGEAADYVAYGYKTVEEKDQLVLEIDTQQTDMELFFSKSDWPEATRIFKIDKLTRSKLILQDNGKTYIFRKF